LRIETKQWPGEPSSRDYCAELEAQMRAREGAKPAMP